MRDKLEEGEGERKEVNTILIDLKIRSMFSAIWNVCVWTLDYPFCGILIMLEVNRQLIQYLKSLDLPYIIRETKYHHMPQATTLSLELFQSLLKFDFDA